MNTLKEVERILRVYAVQGEVKIDEVDYYLTTDNDEKLTTARGSLSVDLVLNELNSRHRDYLGDLEDAIKYPDSDDEKLDAILSLTPAMYDEGVLGVYLEVNE